MDKFEYRLKLDEIDNLFEAGDYRKAAEIADEVDWRRVGSADVLTRISTIYAINRRYDDAIEILLMANERHPAVKQIYYNLCELYIKKEDLVHALEYLKQYNDLNPDEFSKMVLKYKYLSFMGAGTDELIAVLEKACEADYTERWAYELAKLYDKAGYEEKCIDECDQIAAWFGNGRFVQNALELKQKYTELTPKQNDILHRGTVADIAEEESGDTKVFTAEDAEAIRLAAEEADNLVKTADVSEFNTINLQASLAEELSKFYATEEDPVKVKLMESMQNTARIDTEEIKKLVRAEEESRKKAENAEAVTDAKELFATDEAEADETANSEANAHEASLDETDVAEETDPVEAEAEAILAGEEPEEATAEEAAEVATCEEEPQEEISEEPEEVAATPLVIRTSSEPDVIKMRIGQETTVFPRPEISKALAQDDDGQISFVYPEGDSEEKQIPGQMSIEDILREWERMKKEVHNRQEKEVTTSITKTTHKMFSDFEASVRDSLLEKIERGEIEISKIDEEANKELGIEEVNTEEAELAYESVNIDESVSAEETQNNEETEADEAPEMTEEIVPEEAVSEDITSEETEEPAKEEFDDVFSNYFALAEQQGILDGADSSDEETEDLAEEPEEVPEDIVEDDVESAEDDAESAEDDGAEELAEEPAEVIEASEEDNEPAQEETAKEKKESDSVEEEKDIPKQKTPVRKLNNEEEAAFIEFLHDDEDRKMIAKMLDTISLASCTGNVIITGDDNLETINLAKKIVQEFERHEADFTGKISKISGNKLNDKNIDEVFGERMNGAIVIQKASGLEEHTVKDILRWLNNESRGILIIIEDNEKSMERLLSENPDIKTCFNAKVKVSSINEKSLVEHGIKYAREKEFAIDAVGELALRGKISELQRPDYFATKKDVEEIIDAAIVNAKKVSIRHFFMILVSKRYDKDDMIVITEKDFK